MNSVLGYLKLKCVFSVSVESQNVIAKMMIVFKQVLPNAPPSAVGWNKTDLAPSSHHWLSQCCCCQASQDT